MNEAAAAASSIASNGSTVFKKLPSTEKPSLIKSA
jgi:hypothetical protein